MQSRRTQQQPSEPQGAASHWADELPGQFTLDAAALREVPYTFQRGAAPAGHAAVRK
jgi:hypothetical protein